MSCFRRSGHKYVQAPKTTCMCFSIALLVGELILLSINSVYHYVHLSMWIFVLSLYMDGFPSYVCLFT